MSIVTSRATWIGYAMCAAGAALFSTKAIFIKLAYQDVLDATLMLAWRNIFALPVFLGIGLWAFMQRRRSGLPMPGVRPWLAAMATGFLGYYLSSYFDFKGLEFISAQLERLVLFSYPIFVMLIGAIWWKQPLTRHGVVAALITYAGLAIVFGLDIPSGGRATVIGSALVLGAALSFAIYQLVAKSYISIFGSVLYTAIAMSSAGLALIFHRWLVSGGAFSAPPRFLWLSFGTAIFATVLPSFLINGALARISPQSVAMISTISPLVTIALAVLLLGEPFTIGNAVGSALVLAGIGFYTWADMRARALPPDDV
jgi:drug/metabolite transporter (DMT)-like permease